MSDTQTSAGGPSFSDRVEDTAFAGAVRTELDFMKRDIAEIKTDVRWLRDNVRPIVFIVGGIPTIVMIVSLAVTLLQ